MAGNLLPALHRHGGRFQRGYEQLLKQLTSVCAHVYVLGKQLKASDPAQAL